jgi:hypothetical protein
MAFWPGGGSRQIYTCAPAKFLGPQIHEGGNFLSILTKDLQLNHFHSKTSLGSEETSQRKEADCCKSSCLVLKIPKF